MPFIGLGLHVLLALLCAVHAVRKGQPLYWLLILFLFPMLGSIVYILAVYLPSTRLEHHAIKAVSAASKTLDPGREVRYARAAYDETPTVQNQMRLANALLDIDQAEEAASLYESARQGPFASDVELRYGMVRSLVACQRYQEALSHLESLHRDEPGFRAESVMLLRARCYAGTSHNDQARIVFKQAVDRFGSFEAYAEYAIWALKIKDKELAAQLQTELDRITRRWNSVNRQHNKPMMQRLKAAQQRAGST